jgi:hypothetical protein
VLLAFDPSNPLVSNLEMAKILQELRRRSSALATCQSEGVSDKRSLDVQDEIVFYRKYVVRESLICQHIYDVMEHIKEEKKGKSCCATVESELKLADLETKLGLQVNSTKDWANLMCRLLGLVVGIRDWVPRSQLTFTLELVLRNSQSVKQKLEERIRKEPVQAQERQNNDGNDEEEADDNNDEEEVHDEVARGPNYENDDLAGFHHVGDEQPSFTGGQNRQIAAHEHITQQKFNNESLNIVEKMSKRKLFKNVAEWTRSFDDSDGEDNDKTDAGRTTQQHIDPVEDEEEEDQVVDSSHKSRSLGPASITKDEYDDDELDLPLWRPFGREGLFPPTWGYGAPVFSSFCVTSVLAEHVPLYHVQVFPLFEISRFETNILGL